MMPDIPKIDVNKSIQKQRLVYKLSAYTIFNYIFTYFFIVVMMGMSIILLIPASLFSTGNQPTILIYILSLTFNVWMVFNIFLVNKLTVVKRSISMKHEDVVHLLTEFDDSLTTIADTPHAIIKISSIGFFSWGSVITVLLTDDNILLNISALALGRDMISPFHAVYNYYKCKRLIDSVK